MVCWFRGHETIGAGSAPSMGYARRGEAVAKDSETERCREFMMRVWTCFGQCRRCDAHIRPAFAKNGAPHPASHCNHWRPHPASHCNTMAPTSGQSLQQMTPTSGQSLQNNDARIWAVVAGLMPTFGGDVQGIMRMRAMFTSADDDLWCLSRIAVWLKCALKKMMYGV